MIMNLFFHTFLTLIFCVWNYISAKILDDDEWGLTCPLECQCQIKNSSQMSFSRWQLEQSTVKTALCVLNNEELDFILRIPSDTEAFTFLQANNGQKIIFTGDRLKHLKDVKIIDMQGSLSNVTTGLTNDVFHELSELKYLALQRIDLTGAEKTFSKLSSLEVLYVIFCTLGYLKWEMLDGLKNLKELYLVQSGIKELYGFAFYGTPELRRLFLSHNDLFSVEADAFVGLLKLQHLDLSNNRIDHLSGLTFPPLPHLQWLELKHNPIKVIFPHCFQFLNGTQHLTLGHKHQPVHLMKFSFRGLYSLIFLHIPNIDNDALNEHMFYDLRSLKHLNLQGRVKIINMRAFNGAHKQLKKLVLNHLQLEKLYKESFELLENLDYLDLSHNHLQSLPNGVFEPLKSLEYLILNNNNLKQVSEHLFLPLPDLRVLRLHHNPWNCTCKMHHWNKEVVVKDFTLEEMCNNKYNCTERELMNFEFIDFIPKCKYPKTFEDQSIFDALEQFSCIT